MTSVLTLEPVELRRLGFIFLPQVVRAIVPPGRVGVYMLLDEQGHPVYVGRSDSCVRQRLANHEHVGAAAYFTWEPLTSERAFHIESWWFHHLFGDAATLNRRHPAPPAHSEAGCPFCGNADLPALRRALPAQAPIHLNSPKPNPPIPTNKQ